MNEKSNFFLSYNSELDDVSESSLSRFEDIISGSVLNSDWANNFESLRVAGSLIIASNCKEFSFNFFESRIMSKSF